MGIEGCYVTVLIFERKSDFYGSNSEFGDYFDEIPSSSPS